MAGRKASDRPRVRKRCSEAENVQVSRCTLGEVLSNVQPDFDQSNYQSKHQIGLKMVFKRVSAERPPKPATTNSGADKPF